MTKVVLSATVDITPEEAKIIGFNKPLGDFTVDVALGYIGEKASSQIDQKFTMGAYGETVKKIFARTSEAANTAISDELKKQLGKEGYEKLQQRAKADLMNQTVPPPPIDNTGRKYQGGS